MATFTLTEASFTPAGFNTPVPIGVNIDLVSLSLALSNATGGNYIYDSLDVTAVTRDGLTATGFGSDAPDGQLVVGDFRRFDGEVSTAVVGFANIVFTPASNRGSFDFFAIGDLSVLNGSEDTLRVDGDTTGFDFSRTGTAPLTLYMDRESRLGIAGQDSYGDHIITANAGNNQVYGYTDFFSQQESSYGGSNTYLLLDGDDLFLGEQDQVSVEGGDGNDLLLGATYSETQQEYRHDQLLGGSGQDTLFGGAGDDVLSGDSGHDWLYASAGADTLDGGTGQDRFLFSNYLLLPPEYISTLEVGPYLGEGISTADLPNVVMDFDASEDLIAMAVDEYALDNSNEGGSGDFLLYAPDVENQQTRRLESVNGGEAWLSYDYIDTSGESSLDNLLILVEQTVSSFGSNQSLSLRTYTGPADQLGRDTSFEVFYPAGQNTSPLSAYDVFSEVSLAHSEAGGVITGGQDKFDLSALQLGDRALVNGEPDGPLQPVETLKLTRLNPSQEESFTLNQLGGQQGVSSVSDFFIDGEISRAAHVEYIAPSDNDGAASLMVYLDLDGNGDLDFSTDGSDVISDMAFLLEDVHYTPEGIPLPDDLNATDLYNPGAGSGLFIFHEEQRSFWFTNPAVPDPNQPRPTLAFDADGPGAVTELALVVQWAALAELYIAYFDRAPDADGLRFWGEQLSAGLSLEAISAEFYRQPETRLRYPDEDNPETFVASVYENVLGRAPDTAGLEFWSSALNGSALSRDQFVLEILRGARAEGGDSTDAEYLEGKAALGLYYAVGAGLNDGDWAADVMDIYQGTATSLQQALDQVDSFASMAGLAITDESLVSLIGIVEDGLEGLPG